MNPETPADGEESFPLSSIEIERWIGEARLICRQVDFSMRELSLSLNGMDVERPIFFAETAIERLYRLQRIFWPTEARCEGRGRSLRELAGFSKGGVFEKAPLASFVERSDERLEEWLRGVPAEGYHEISVMPGSLLGFASSANYLRLMDADTLDFSLRGTQINLKRLAEEARRIDLRLKRWNLRSEIPQ